GSMMAVTLILVAIVCVLLARWLKKRQQHFQQWQNMGIPGPPTHWLAGNFYEINYRPGRADPIKTRDEWIKKYGKVVGFFNGYRPFLLVADLDLLKQIFIKESNNFINRHGVNPRSKMLVSLNDQHWKDVRRIITPIFSTAKIKKMMPLVQNCTQNFIDKCLEMSKAEKEFNIYEILQCLTLDVIDQCALALNLNCIKNPKNKVLVLIRHAFRNLFPRAMAGIYILPELVLLFIPFFIFSPFRKAQRVCIENIKNVIQKRKNNPELQAHQDALQLLMDASEDIDGKITRLTEMEVVENAFMFLIAGYETTSNALAYAFHLLSLHEDVQELVWQELTDVLNDPMATVTYEDLGKMKYTEAVILETMRLYPPIPFFVSRITSSKWSYNGLTIPAGTVVEAPVWSIHHDPEIYPEPKKFKPERFLPEERASRHSLSHLPFGAGPRNCIGLRFALLEAKLTLALTVQKFIIKPAKCTKDPLPTIANGPLMNPKDGVWVTLQSRTSDKQMEGNKNRETNDE
ncbi:unnamed protein product, partial [Meganyctiphanes norvegica]